MHDTLDFPKQEPDDTKERTVAVPTQIWIKQDPEEEEMHKLKLEKIEAEMKKTFLSMVRAKEEKLKTSEVELNAKYREMKEELESKMAELQEIKVRLEQRPPLEKKRFFSLR
jgi:septin family protein